MTSFVLATANPDKAHEMRVVLESRGFTILERPPEAPDVEETEDTLEGNALLKARALSAFTGQAAVADDTGLFVDALNGRPGVTSARYAGVGATYAANVAKLLGEMAGVPDEARGARLRTVIAVCYPDMRALTVEGVLEGTIIRAPRGERGFGYDPVFRPDEIGDRTLAELSASEKNALSHRALALHALARALSQE